MERPALGFVGVGLMGHGMAKNALEKGFPLTVIAHRKREAVEDLVARGAVEVGSLEEMAERCDVIALCVTGAPEVEAAVAALAPAARPGLTILDCSTSRPETTRRLATELAAQGVTLLDAPLSRTPTHAWEGTLTTYVGGPLETIERWRPLLSTWASVIIPTGGPVGSAHALKLVNNSIAIGFVAIWAEAYAVCRAIGAEPSALHAIVSNGGMNCGNFQAFSKYPVEGDPEGHKFTIVNMLKDIGYYRELANAHRCATPMSSGAHEMAKLAVNAGLGDRNVAQMLDLMHRLNGAAG